MTNTSKTESEGGDVVATAPAGDVTQTAPIE